MTMRRWRALSYYIHIGWCRGVPICSETYAATFSDDLKLIFQYTPNRFLHHVRARLLRQTVPLPI